MITDEAKATLWWRRTMLINFKQRSHGGTCAQRAFLWVSCDSQYSSSPWRRVERTLRAATSGSYPAADPANRQIQGGQ